MRLIVLLSGLLAGIPYGIAILKKSNERLINAWRVAHSALPMGAILLLVISVSFSGLNVAINLKWAISILFIISGYGFMVALLLGNVLGAITSLFGTVVLLYAAWLNL